MRALQITAFGGPEVMQIVDISQPEPGPDEVLVKVEAAGLNYSDLMIRHNTYLESVDLPYNMGREFAGMIEAVGENVRGYQAGQKVVGTTAGGAMAEYVVTRPTGLLPYPGDLPAATAAALIIQGVTALHCLTDAGQVQEGETVLIHAAAGGVGSLAVQLATLRGAQVIGTASSDEKCELIRELGGEAINYKDTDWVAELMKLTNRRGVDLILESVGGDVFTRSFREALAPFGRMVVYGVASQKVEKISNAELLGSGKTLVGYYLPNYYTRTRMHRIGEAALELASLVYQGKLKTVIGKIFELENAVDAFNFMQERRSTGKVIIKP